MPIRKLDSIPDVEEVFLSPEQMRALEGLQQEIADKMWRHSNVRAKAVVVASKLAENDPVVLAAVSMCRRKGWEARVVSPVDRETRLVFRVPWKITEKKRGR